MTEDKARSIANECVNTLILAGILEEKNDFNALDLITERLLVNMNPDHPFNTPPQS